MSQPEFPFNVAYWNALLLAAPEQQAAYAQALFAATVPQVLFLDECRPDTADILRDKGLAVDFPDKPTQMYKGVAYGVAVVSTEELNVRRVRKWPEIAYSGKIGGIPFGDPFYDNRESVRAEVEHPDLGVIAVWAAHISQPHYVWEPKLNQRRRHEWAANGQLLANEDGPFLWMADTNTIRASKVEQALELERLGAQLLPHLKGRTWAPEFMPDHPVFYLDRVAASHQLIGRTTLTTMPQVVRGVRNPSDHAAIVATVSHL